MEGLKTGLFLFGASGVKIGSADGGTGKCWGECGMFSQLALPFWGSWFDAGEERIPEAMVQNFFHLDKDSLLECLEGPSWFP